MNNISKFSSRRKTRHEIIYVDESGNAGMRKLEHNRKHPFFIMGFCYCKKSKKLNKHLHKLLLELHKDNLYPSKLKEIKFYPTPALLKLGYSTDEIEIDWAPNYSTVRNKTARAILDKSDGIFAGILKKTDIQDKTCTAENIGNILFKKSLFDNILPNISTLIAPQVIYDRGRLNHGQTKAFNKDMHDAYAANSDKNVKDCGGQITFRDTDSLKTPGIWASDFIAGAFHLALKHNDSTYRDLLKPNFIADGSFRLS